jgi:hypothetical protein
MPICNVSVMISSNAKGMAAMFASVAKQMLAILMFSGVVNVKFFAV